MLTRRFEISVWERKGQGVRILVMHPLPFEDVSFGFEFVWWRMHLNVAQSSWIPYSLYPIYPGDPDIETLFASSKNDNLLQPFRSYR